MDIQNTIATINETRKKIEYLIDNFSRYVSTGDCEKVIIDFFHKISFYTNDLLITEKLLLKEKNIEQFNRLLKEHDRFADKMIAFQKDYEQKKPDLCNELLDFLKNWYAEHILYFDKDLKKYL